MKTDMENVAKNAITDITKLAEGQVNLAIIKDQMEAKDQRIAKLEEELDSAAGKYLTVAVKYSDKGNEVGELKVELQTVLNCLDWVVTDREMLRTNTTIVLDRLVKKNIELRRNIKYPLGYVAGDFT